MKNKNLNRLIVAAAILLVAVVGISVAEISIPAYNPPGLKVPSSKYPPPQSAGVNVSFIFYGFVYAWIIIAVVGVILYRKSVGKDVLKEIVIGLVAFFITFLIFFAILLLGNQLRWSNTGTPESYSSSPYWNAIYFYVALTFFIFIIVYAILKSVRFEEEEIEVKKEVPRKYVERAIYHLKLGEDVRSSILKAYREMEKIIRGRGVEDKKYYTPREFRNVVISELKISSEPVDNLTALFEKARYSTEEMTEEDRNEALRNLEMIRDEISS